MLSLNTELNTEKNKVRSVNTGGTGLSKVTSGYFLVGNGTGALTAKSPSSALGLMGGAKIVKSSYVGKGFYGSSNPCILTFDGVPKLVLIQAVSRDTFGSRSMMLAINGTTEAELFPMYGSGSAALEHVKLTWSENSVSWYSTESARDQMNTENKVYNYIVIY